jgi:hypothetical protein
VIDLDRLAKALEEVWPYEEEAVYFAVKAADLSSAYERARAVTHGRHCPCSACAQQDWGDPMLGPCGEHGPGCARVYAPQGTSESEQWPTEATRRALDAWNDGYQRGLAFARVYRGDGR